MRGGRGGHRRSVRSRSARERQDGRVSGGVARRLDEARRQGRRARLLPDVDAEPARRADRRRVAGHLLRRQGPQLPRQLPLARRHGQRRRPRQLPRLSGPDDDSRRARPLRSKGAASSAARRTASPIRTRTISVGNIHATVYSVNQDADQWHVLLRVASQRVALHRERARDRAVHVRAGREEPAEAAAQPRPRRPEAVGRDEADASPARRRRGRDRPRRGRHLRARRPALRAVDPEGARRRSRCRGRRNSTCSTGSPSSSRTASR